MRIAFRCDGDRRVGAGHVGRCLQIAAAFTRAGHQPRFIGRHSDLAADLLSAAGFGSELPAPEAPAGIPADVDAALVDSYEILPAELERLAKMLPVATFCDREDPPAVAAALHYHLSLSHRPGLSPGTAGLIGPDYAPVSPRLVAARRDRGLTRALVTVGGSEGARATVEPAVKALGRLGVPDVFVAGSGRSPDIGLVERIAWADVAISAAGTTAYELACAGVPTVAVALVDNQAPVATGMSEAGVARSLDACSTDLEEQLMAEVATLASPEERARLTASGPATVDGHGAARARDALLAVFAGHPVPRVLRYRPALGGDAARILAWRNDPEVRAASRNQETIDPGGHRAWMDRTLSDPDRVLLIAEHEGEPVGSLRFDRRREEAEISVSIAAERRGGGLATQAIREGSELFLAAFTGVHRLLAEVRPENAASLRAFQRAGYRFAAAAPADEMRVLERSAPIRSSPT